MRKSSSTTVVLVGEVGDSLVARAGRFPNVSVVSHPEQGLEPGVEALRQAADRSAPYVLVTADPLAEVAAEWRAMWDISAGAHRFEERAGEALLAWKTGRFELPDYYMVAAREQAVEVGAPHPQDLYLGVLGSIRPARVIPVSIEATAEDARRLVRALSRLPHGPWWPELDRLIESARNFFPGRLSGRTGDSETRVAAGSGPPSA